MPSGKKTDAVDLIGQAVGVVTDNGNCVLAVVLEYLYPVGRAYAVALKENHNLPDLLLLLPCTPYHLNPLLSDALHLVEPFYFIPDDVEGLNAEFPHEPLRHDRANPLDEA